MTLSGSPVVEQDSVTGLVWLPDVWPAAGSGRRGKWVLVGGVLDDGLHAGSGLVSGALECTGRDERRRAISGAGR
jgi:hypothetical protein